MRRAAWIASALLAGCAVGPDYQTPTPPQAADYTPQPLPTKLVADESVDGPTQTLTIGEDIRGDWWTLFHSPALNALVERALADNQDLAAAQAALVLARENVYAQEGAFFPSLSASFTPSRNKTATGSLSPTTASGNPYYSLYTTQFNVAYNPDVFGLLQRQTEQVVATGQNQRFVLEATYLTLTSNLVGAAITEASLRAQIAATEDVVKVERDLLRILQVQMNLGQIARVDELAQEAAVAQAEASLPPLQRQLAQNRDMITALSGRLSGEGSPETFDLASISLPDTLPVSLPSKLVEQRPDVRQAVENLHGASAAIGIAVANRLPLLSLTAYGGGQSINFANQFVQGNLFWTLAGSVTQPIFDGGTLLHRERGARAAFDQAAAMYRSTVIDAFQNVADALQALKADADAVRAAAAAARAAAAALKIVRVQLSLGAVAYLSVLNAEQTELQARLTLVQAQASRLNDTAALLQALGGCWWNRDDVKVEDVNGDDVLGVLGLH